jgi:hypothetical protein
LVAGGTAAEASIIRGAIFDHLVPGLDLMSAELECLHDRFPCQVRPADAGGETEIVLDS